MLEYYFDRPVRLRRLRRGPLAPYLDGMAAELRQHGYQRLTEAQILGIAGEFSRFLQTCGVCDITGINEELGRQFINEELKLIGDFRWAPNAIRHILRYLRQIGVVAELEQVPETCESYVRSARRFLDFHMDRHQELVLSGVDGPEVLDYITAWAGHSSSPSWTRGLSTNTRSFVRFLRWENIISGDLARVIPSMPRWRLNTVPNHLPWGQVQKMIDIVNTASPDGMRDKAILLLLATLGLRNYDVRTLEFSHIDWRESEIRLPKTKSMRARVLPLSQELGEALVDYITSGRPNHPTSFVFLRHKAPVGPFTTPGGIAGIVQRYVNRLGTPAHVRHRGSHMLRHSLAAKMVNSGSSLKDVGDMLGHLHTDTTAIYAKVDTVHLHEVAMPFPGGEA